ncbi:putative quinol monooxygenase [Nocardia sp. CA-120079]|uniref:putative quinol monooxygenase n=1 Tax=Nocardia sp. CA-120079 TaxID=3239974 RepID=UPI003D98D14D
MITLTVSLQVTPGYRDEFLAAIEQNARSSFTDEPGCRYFDVVCDLDDDLHFVFHEVYDDEEAVAAHRAAPHFKLWREAVSKYVVPGSQVNTLSRRLFHHS